MIDPPPPCFIAGTAARQPKKVPSRWTASVRRQISVVVRRRLAMMAMPALLTNTSRRPWLSMTRSTSAGQLASSDTSCATNSAPISSAIARPRGSLMSVMMTDAPSAASIRASAAPRPDAAPVMMATFPCTRPMLPPAWPRRIHGWESRTRAGLAGGRVSGERSRRRPHMGCTTRGRRRSARRLSREDAPRITPSPGERK